VHATYLLLLLLYTHTHRHTQPLSLSHILDHVSGRQKTLKLKKMKNSMMEIQHRIRQNALLTREYLTDLNRWEENIRKKDEKRKTKKKKTRSLPPVRGSSVLSTTSTSNNKSRAYDPRLGRCVPKESSTTKKKDKSAASHTYDKGYKKWESFDVDAALKNLSDGEEEKEEDQKEKEENKEEEEEETKKRRVVTSTKPVDTRPRTEIERERGNIQFRRGEFAEAIKSYTKAIGHDSKSTASYSNRAMAHLKLSDYRRALTDCNAALRLDPKYVKALLRRGMASNGLGRHRAALRDLVQALRLSPGSKKLKVELRKTREYVRTSARRAPRIKIPVSLDSDDDDNDDDVSIPLPLSSSSPPVQEVVMEKEDVEKDETKKKVEEKKKRVEKKTDNDVVATTAAAAKIARISQQKKITFTAPKTSYEFERVWKSLRSDSNARSKYLKTMDSKRVSSIFKHSVEQDTFVQITETLKENVKDWSAKEIVNLLLAFTSVKRFDMIVMFLSSEETSTIKFLLETFSSSSSNNDETLSKSLKLLRKRFSL